MHKSVYKCVSNENKDSGFEKGQLYFFYYNYGVMINRDLEEYYFWLSDNCDFVKEKGILALLKAYWQYFKYKPENIWKLI